MAFQNQFILHPELKLLEENLKQFSEYLNTQLTDDNRESVRIVNHVIGNLRNVMMATSNPDMMQNCALSIDGFSMRLDAVYKKSEIADARSLIGLVSHAVNDLIDQSPKPGVPSGP